VEHELTTLKNEAMASHRLWETCGKPKTGDIFAEKNKQKLLYKNAIREAKNDANNKISSQLQELLLSKDCPSSWKTWKKICKPSKAAYQKYLQE
jgi:hypothetical protein